MTNAILLGMPDAENPHARFDGGESHHEPQKPLFGGNIAEGRASVCAATPRRGSLLYKRILLAATATIALAATTVQGQSSAEATFDSFSSEFRTSASVEASVFLSRYRTIEDSDALSSFDSSEPTGFTIFVR